MKYRLVIKFFIGVAISALLLYLAFTKVEISIVINSLKNTKLGYIFLGIILFFLSLVVRTFLLKLLLSSNHLVKFYPLFKSIVIGHMGNNVLPFRGGELLRIYSIKKTCNVIIPIAISSLAVERVLDLISLTLLTGLLSFFVNIPDFLKNSIFFIIVFCVSLLVIMIYFANTRSFQVYVNLIIKFCPNKYRDSVESVFENLMRGLSPLKNISLFLKIITLSLSCWGLVYFSIFFGLLAYNLELNWIMPLCVLVLLNVGMMVPTLPASLGVYQFITVIALSYFYIDKSIALGFSFLLQAMDFIPSVILGIVFLYRQNTTNFFQINK